MKLMGLKQLIAIIYVKDIITIMHWVVKKINYNKSVRLIVIINVLGLGAIIANNSKSFSKNIIAIIANNCI
jgi:hypothetical protein